MRYLRRFVYVVRCGDFIKIGIASHVPSRIAQMQTGNPITIKLLAKFNTFNPERMEAELHEKLGKHRVRGEWFKVDAVLQSWIDSVT